MMWILWQNYLLFTKRKYDNVEFITNSFVKLLIIVRLTNVGLTMSGTIFASTKMTYSHVWQKKHSNVMMEITIIMFVLVQMKDGIFVYFPEITVNLI